MKASSSSLSFLTLGLGSHCAGNVCVRDNKKNHFNSGEYLMWRSSKNTKLNGKRMNYSRKTIAICLHPLFTQIINYEKHIERQRYCNVPLPQFHCHLHLYVRSVTKDNGIWFARRIKSVIRSLRWTLFGARRECMTAECTTSVLINFSLDLRVLFKIAC